MIVYHPVLLPNDKMLRLGVLETTGSGSVSSYDEHYYEIRQEIFGLVLDELDDEEPLPAKEYLLSYVENMMGLPFSGIYKDSTELVEFILGLKQMVVFLSDLKENWKKITINTH